jgi:signal transduction histidine kinase
MSKKLLNKTTANFLAFAVFVLLVSAPAFYYMTNWLYIEETDETLELHKVEFKKHFLPTLKRSDIALWNRYNRNEQIIEGRNSVRDTLYDKVYFDALENENEPYRELSGPITIDGRNYTWIGRINLIERTDMVESTAALFLLVIVILLAGILIIAKNSSKRLWTPFYDTLAKIQGFEIDKSKKPVFATTQIDEFNQLNKSLDCLIEKNIEIYNSQREFVENAAHELQTPLALFQTKIDTFLQLDLSEGQSEILASLNNDVARLNRLNKNLLLLSKIENESRPEKQTVVINDLIKKNLDFFTEQAAAKNLAISTELDEIVRVESAPELVEILVNNLFLNTIRHNIVNGSIIVRSTEATLSFLNTGEKPLPSERMFNRFSKSDPSSPGSGLGLAIVKKIAEMNGWEIRYNFAEKFHHFTVRF